MVTRTFGLLLLLVSSVAPAGAPPRPAAASPARKPVACVAMVERVQAPGGRWELVEALGPALAAAWAVPQCEGEAAEGGKAFDVETLRQRYELVVLGTATWRVAPGAKPDGTATSRASGEYKLTLLDPKSGAKNTPVLGALVAAEEPGGAAAATRASAKASVLAVAKQFESALPLAAPKGN